MKTIPKWLQNRQSKFQTCYEVWQELNNAALSKQLTAEQSAQADKMIAQWNKIHEKLQYEPDPESEDWTELRRIYHEEFYHLTEQIQKYWEEHGYTDPKRASGAGGGMKTQRFTTITTSLNMMKSSSSSSRSSMRWKTTKTNSSLSAKATNMTRYFVGR